MEVLIQRPDHGFYVRLRSSSVTATILVDPAGVVFDSHSNALVAGAKVTLIDVTGNGNGGNPNSPRYSAPV